MRRLAIDSGGGQDAGVNRKQKASEKRSTLKTRGPIGGITEGRSGSQVGLVGLGLMGSAMAGRWMAAGFSVYGFDSHPDRRSEWTQAGGRVAGDAAEVFRSCSVVAMSLPNSDVVGEVIAATRKSLRRGMLVIDTTTGDPEATRRLGAALARRGVGYVDATVVGSSEMVRTGEVQALVGGRAVDFERAKPFLEVFARHVCHTGLNGSGARMKLVANLVLGLNRAVLAEGLAYAESQGIPAGEALEALRGGLAYSRIMDTKGARMIQRDFRPQARLSQHLKDVRLMLAGSGGALPLTETHRRILERAEAMGFGEADNSAIVEVFRAGLLRGGDEVGNGVRRARKECGSG